MALRPTTKLASLGSHVQLKQLTRAGQLAHATCQHARTSTLIVIIHLVVVELEFLKKFATRHTRLILR